MLGLLNNPWLQPQRVDTRDYDSSTMNTAIPCPVSQDPEIPLLHRQSTCQYQRVVVLVAAVSEESALLLFLLLARPGRLEPWSSPGATDTAGELILLYI